MRKIMEPRPLKHVALLGLGNSLGSWVYRNRTSDPFPIGEEGCEVWAVNQGGWLLRADMAVDMHDPELWKAKGSHWDSVKRFGVPTMCTRAVPELPNTFEFPIELAVEKFQDNYFRLGPAYAVCFAMLCGVKRLEIFGMDFGSTEEEQYRYEVGRSSMEVWMERARASGMQIDLPPNTNLMDMVTRLSKGHLYGYAHQPTFHVENERMRVELAPDFAKIDEALQRPAALDFEVGKAFVSGIHTDH